MVDGMLWEHEAAGSNPVTWTKNRKLVRLKNADMLEQVDRLA